MALPDVVYFWAAATAVKKSTDQVWQKPIGGLAKHGRRHFWGKVYVTVTVGNVKTYVELICMWNVGVEPGWKDRR